MRVIDHRQFGKKKPKSAGRSKAWRTSIRIVAILAALFLLANIIIWVSYRGKALPNTVLGTRQVGGMSYDAIARLKQTDVLPEKVTFTREKVTKDVALSQLGMQANMTKSLELLKKERSWLPVIDLVTKHHAPLSVTVDEANYRKAIDGIRSDFSVAPTDKHVAFNGQAFVVEQGKDGYQMQDDKLRKNLLASLTKNSKSVQVPTEVVKTVIHDIDLSEEIERLKKEVATKLSFGYKNQSQKPTLADVGGWYAPEGQSLVFSSDKFNQYINGVAAKFGITASNQSDLALATEYSLSKGIDANYVVTSSAARDLKYCVAARGANETLLRDMAGKLAATYADARGWNDGGSTAFTYVANGCDYTVWLSAPNQMTSFGAICDNYYNCQVGTNVVVNSDRWLSATDAWNQTGRSLEEYRALIINHESGHRLGYYDKNVCSAPGQLAPVMMQQSIDLMGCTFNAWPLQNELDGL